jgi:hypothetical protein
MCVCVCVCVCECVCVCVCVSVSVSVRAKRQECTNEVDKESVKGKRRWAGSRQTMKTKTRERPRTEKVNNSIFLRQSCKTRHVRIVERSNNCQVVFDALVNLCHAFDVVRRLVVVAEEHALHHGLAKRVLPRGAEPSE